MIKIQKVVFALGKIGLSLLVQIVLTRSDLATSIETNNKEVVSTKTQISIHKMNAPFILQYK